jgi:hypothetical protein
MTQEIIEMAIEAGLAFDSEEYPEIWSTYMNVGKKEIQAFANLVAAKEREACAKLIDDIEARCIAEDVDDQPLKEVAAAIRARGEQA